MKNTLALIALVTGLMVAGCNQMTWMEESRDNAAKKWAKSRSETLVKLAGDNLKVGKIDTAHSQADEACQLDPSNENAARVFVKTSIEQTDYEQALKLLGTLIEKNPQDGELYYLRGIAMEKSGQARSALTNYQYAAQLSPKSLAPTLAVAEVLVGLDRLSEADDMIQSHLRTNNSDPGLYELAGRIASRRGEHLRSAGYFHKAVLIDHENRRYPELLAREQFHARQYRKCRTTIQSAMQLADYQPPVWMQAMLGDCHMALSAWQEAYSAYQRVCDIQPANADAWCRLAKAALAGNDNTRAIQNAYKARSLQEDHYDATVILALAMIKDKRPDLAARVLSNARTSHPHDSTLRCLLGKAYAAMGKPQQAQECYAVALRLDPENDLARALASGRMGEK